MFANKYLKTVPSLFDSEQSDIPTKPNDSLEEDCWVITVKGKVHRNEQSQRKRQKVTSDPDEVSVENVTAKEREEKSRTESETRKRLWTSTSQTGEDTKVTVIDLTHSSDEELSAKQSRTEKGTWKRLWTSTNHTDEDTKVSVEVVMTKGTKRKSVTETETSNKRLRTSTSQTGEDTKVSEVDLTQTSDLSSSTSTGISPFSVNTSRDNFEAKYVQLEKLGQGGFGSVYAGNRKTDNLPVAIKHMSRGIKYGEQVIMGQTYKIPVEVMVMQRLAAGDDSVGKSAAVSLLDWYDLDEEVILVMERPVPSVDMSKYMTGPLKEHEAKDIMKQLVDAAIQMHSQGVFHRDIKQENILIETSTDIPRVRIIDFGCGSFSTKTSHSVFHGTFSYFPPEFIEQGAYEAGPTTVWQLGAVLYEMLSGCVSFHTERFLLFPLRAANDLEVLKVTKDCRDLLKMCLLVDPTQRVTLEDIPLHPWFN